jgi:hypothetical protein
MPRHFKFILSGLSIFMLCSCASDPHEAKKIKTEMERSERVGGENVGTKDGKMIIQNKAMLAEELRRLHVSVYELEDGVYGNQELGSWGLYGVLKDCRKKISSKEYGGTGKLMWIEKIDRVTDKEDDIKLGIDENNELVAVKEEFLRDRIDRFQKYKKILTSRKVEFKDKIDVCEAELQSRMHELKNKQK